MSQEPEGTTPAAIPEPSPPEADTGENVQVPSKKSSASDWENSYKGLQGAYQKLKNQSDAAIADLNRKLQDLTAANEELKQGGSSKESQMEVLLAQVSNLKEQITALEAEKTAAHSKLSRSQLVMEEFPELAHWEAQGLLPNGAGDDPEALRQQFDKFRSALTSQVGQGVRRTMQTASPPGSSASSASAADHVSENEDFVWQKLTETAGRRDKAQEFAEWQKKWDAIQASKA